MTRLVLVAGVAGLLFGCGGGLTPPPLHSFNYGASVAPDPSQQGTADNAQSSVGVILGSPSNTSNAEMAPTLTDDLASSLPAALISQPMNALPGTSSSALEMAGRDGLVRGLRSSSLQASCATVTSTTITYSHCSYNSDSYNGTLDGSINVGANSVTWNLNWTFSLSSQGVTGNGTFNWSGQINWTATNITGSGRSAFTVHASANGQSADVASTSGVDLNLTYASNPFCITGGTLEIRRVVVATSGSQNENRDGAVKFTWSGCGAVTVAIGT
jgi:hypothetical protein